MLLTTTATIIIGKTVAGLVIKKLCDSALSQIKGWVSKNNEKRALATAASISLDKFRLQSPVIYEKLFSKEYFWLSFEEEFFRFLDHQQPNIKGLASKIEDISPVPKRELSKKLNCLFRILREEIKKQNDLKALEHFLSFRETNQNIEAIRKKLGIDSVEGLDAKARIASERNLDQFASDLCIPNKVVELGFNIDNDNITNKEVIEYLANGHKIILEADPGAGKTTTLFQISKALLDKNEEIFPVFISLSNWLKSMSFFEYITQQDAFSEQQLDPDGIRTLARYGHLVLVIDGWNELLGDDLKVARTNIKNFQIDYPSVGILIATRFTSLPPTLNMRLNIVLNRLDNQKRRDIIYNVLGGATETFVAEIRNKDLLIEITQIPFYLDILIKVYQEDGSLPETKEEVLHKFVYARDDKEVFIEELYNCHHDYMIALSVEMLKARATTLEETHARQVIVQESQRLVSIDMIQTPSEPLEILELLAKHHLLIYRKDGNQWQFQHQQFQEWYASRYVEQVIIGVDKDEATDLKKLCDPILNIPLWEEPLLFAVERLSQQEEHRDALSKVVINALKIDPLLSAEIIYRADDAVWSKVQEPVIDYAKRWHHLQESAIDYAERWLYHGKTGRALAFMIASNRPEFSDQILPLIAHKDPQIRCGALRAFEPFRVGCLGEDLYEKWETYSEDIRTSILYEIALTGGIEVFEFVTGIAVNDSSSTVKIGVLDATYYRNSKKHSQQLLENASPEVWKAFFKHITPDEIEDDDMREQIIKNIRDELDKSTSNVDRLRLLLRLWRFGDTSIKDEILEALVSLEDEKDNRWHVFRLMEQVAKIDPQRITSVLINVMIEGGHLPSGYEQFIVHAEKEDRRRLADFIIKDKGHFSYQSKFAKVLEKDEAMLLLNKLLDLSDEIATLKPKVPKALYDHKYNLEMSIRGIPESHLVEAMVELHDLSNQHEDSFTPLNRLARIFSDIYNLINSSKKTTEQSSSTLLEEHHIAALTGLFAWPESKQGDQPNSHKLMLTSNLSTSFRAVLNNWSVMLRDSSDGNRHSLVEISMVLGRIGNEEDLKLINELLQYDQGYRAKLLMEWEQGGRSGQRPDDLGMSYTNLYRRAFEAMPHRCVVDIVAPYLNNPDFYKEAAYIIRHAWFMEHGLLNRDKYWSPGLDFSNTAINAKKLENQERPEAHPYSALILNRIKELLPDQEDSKVKGMLFELAGVVADTEYGNKISVLEEVISIKGDNRKYVCILKLLQRGERISSSVIKPCYEQALQEWKDQHSEQDDRWFIVGQWLDLLALSDNPMEVVDLVKDLPDRVKLRRGLVGLLMALQYSPSKDAENTLIALAEAIPSLQADIEWFRAICDQGSEASHEFLYSILWDPIKTKSLTTSGHSDKVFANTMAKMLRNNPKIKKDFIGKLSTPLAHTMAEVLGYIIQQLIDDEEIMSTSLMLLRNKVRIPYSLKEAIEDHVTHKEPPKEEGQGYYSYYIFPSSALKLRRQLLEMSVSDLERNEAAKSVLEWIDELRDKYGRPVDEPRHPCLESGIPWPLSING
jgi:hypothetical protein